MPKQTALSKKIAQITNDDADEANLYAFIKELLTRSTYGVGLGTGQVVIDSKVDDSLRRPDLVAYASVDGKPAKGPDYAKAVFEVKVSNKVEDGLKAVLNDKQSYIQPGTDWFFLIDQHVVARVPTRDRVVLGEALQQAGALPASLVTTWQWDDLREPDRFAECFGVLSADALKLESELAAFKAGETPYQFIPAEGDDRGQFSESIREASSLLRTAVHKVIEEVAAPDLSAAMAAVSAMAKDYGEPVYDWANAQRPIEFSAMLAEDEAAGLSDDLVLAYDARHDAMMGDLEARLYALRIEHVLLRQYAERQGVTNASLTDLGGKKSETRTLLASLVYETSSLILSRMLMIRFCEDYGLFKDRYISNGGVAVFWNFAEHFDRPMQALLRETYRLSAGVFRSIFDASLLDWAVERDDQVLSDALTRAAYILSRWDFSTVRGDILSGVYDAYLDVAQRRRLGEVYTRPEVARFMLAEAGWKPTDTVLDPSCGTGTFLVEVLVKELARIDATGGITDSGVRTVLERLNGLDISPFSVALAQLQVFWHLIELMKDKGEEEARSFAQTILPALRIYGGWSSLDPLGRSFRDEEAEDGDGQEGLQFRVGRRRAGQIGRAGNVLVPPGFAKASGKAFDLVVMNPPYIRSERQGSTDYKAVYGDVAYKGTDTSIYFIYRALKHWVKPGGRLAFIVPIWVLEAEYSGRLRALLKRYKIKMIADLEGLGKATFRGIKRATVIVVVEKIAAGPDDVVEVVQLDATAVVDGVIDFTKGRRSKVLRTNLDRARYMPSWEVSASLGDQSPVWASAIRSDDDGSPAILSKLAADDVQPLASMGKADRLGDLLKVVWARRDGGQLQVAKERPKQEAIRWSPEILFAHGVKLGGKKALSSPTDEGAIPLYKGQNVFPQGLLGEPMGWWSPTARKETTRYIYNYSNHLTFDRTYVVRTISQLPTVAKAEAGIGYQNTVFVFELVETFPFDSYVLSRIVQFFAAQVLRSSIVEDFGCTWIKRTLPFIPVPSDRSPAMVAMLDQLGNAVIDADEVVANRFREIDRLAGLHQEQAVTLANLIADDAAAARGIDLKGVQEEATPIGHLQELNDTIAADDLLFEIVVPDPNLRAFLTFALQRNVEASPEDGLTRQDVLDVPVPSNLAEVATAIRSLATDDLEQRFLVALGALDEEVAQQLGLSVAERDYVIKRMTNDPFLSRLRPMLAQRGLKHQPYSDHSSGGRY